MIYVVPLGLALIFTLFVLLPVFLFFDDSGEINEQSWCKLMFLIFLIIIIHLIFSCD